MREYAPRSLPTPADLPLFTRARATDPDTSHAADRSLDADTILDALLAIYRAARPRGLTDEEAGDALGIDGAWKRCSDLRRLMAIHDTGERRKGSSGRFRMVCRFTE